MKKGKTRRRWLALVLCLAMLFSCVPQGAIPVFAAGDDTASQGQPETGETPTEPEVTTEPTEPEDTTAPTEPEVTTEPTEPEDTTMPTESEVDTDSSAAPLDVVQSGTAGENITWTLTDDGLLTISGEGPMKDYAYTGINIAPWNDLGVTRVLVEEGVTSVGAYAFYADATIQEVTLPQGLTAIGSYAFQKTGLEQLILPDSLKIIDDYAFDECSVLRKVVLSASLEEMGKGAFLACESLESVTLPDRSITMGASIFSVCKRLTEVIMPAGFTVIGEGMFSSCENLTTLDLSHVTSLGENAFQKSGMEKADLSSIVTMGDRVFGDCGNLRTVTLGKQLTQIPFGAFDGCVSLEEIIIPGNVRIIDRNAFYDCTALRRVVLEEGVTTVVEQAFYGASALEEITFPASLLEVEANALSGCRSLQTVILTSQGEKCFAGQIARQNTGASFRVAVPDGGSLSAAGVGALVGVGAVGLRVNPGETVVLQDALQVGTWSMPLGALPAGTYTADAAGNLYRLSDNAAVLAYCAGGEESFVVPASVICHDEPYPVTAVGGYAFAGCDSLTTLTFENLAAIASLEDYAFASSKLTSINEKTTAEEILQTFPGEVSLGVELFWNSPLGTASEPGPAAGDITVEQNGLRVTLNTTAGRPDDTDGTKLCWTGQNATVSITADGSQTTGSAEQQIVLYFRFTDPQGGFTENYEMGEDYDMPGGYTMRISRASTPGGYFVVLQQPVVGGTYTFSWPVSYPSGSAGGTLFVSAAITEKDAPLKIPALTAGNYHAVRWETRRNEYTINQTANWSYTLEGDGTSDGVYLNSGSNQYTVTFTQIPPSLEGNYGQDLRTYIDFTYRIQLPKGVQAADWLQEAIKTNAYEAYSAGGITVQKSDGTSTTINIRSSAYTKNFTVAPKMFLEEDGEDVQTLVLAWRSYNEAIEGGEDAFANGFTIQWANQMFCIPDVALYNESNPDGGKVVTTLSAETHYQFSEPLPAEDNEKSLSVPRGKSELTLTNSLTGGSSGSMGQTGVGQTLTLKNTGALPYDVGGWTLKELIPSSHYIKHNAKYEFEITLDTLMEKASEDERFDLQVIIRGTTLYVPIIPQTYWDIRKTQEYTTSLSDTAYYPDYSGGLIAPEENKDNIVADNVQITITSGIGGYTLTVQSAEGAPIDKFPNQWVKPGELAQAMADIGFSVTQPAAYELVWYISEDCILRSGESISMNYDFDGKDTYEYIQQDTLYAIGDFDDQVYTFGPIIANLYDANDSIVLTKTATKSPKIVPEVRLDNEVTAQNDDSDINRLKEGDILQYRAHITFRHILETHTMPLVQRSTGPQVLVASVADNPDATWAAGLETVELEDGVYYVLDREGTYEGVWIDREYVAVVTVKKSEDGWDTLLKRYYVGFYSYKGDPKGTYKTMIKLPEIQGESDEENQFFYMTGQAWLNDSPTHRLYAPVSALPIAAFDLEKEIVSAPEDGVPGVEHSAIEGGQTVYYRLSFWKKYADIPVTITGDDIKDTLPLSLADSGIRWTENNVKITTTSGAVKNPDYWKITQDPDNPNQQYIEWDADFSMELSLDTPVTLYVTLTFPDGEDWQAYTKAYASQTLSNTIEVSGIRDSVYQDVWIGGSARLQKGVFANGYYQGHDEYRPTLSIISYSATPTEDDRLYYENDSIRGRVLTYYVTLYNDGPTKLYLTEMQDCLPEGFTGLGILHNGLYNTTYAYADQAYSWGASFGGDPVATVAGVSPDQYRIASVHRTVDEKTGMEKFTFTRDDNSDISYDENVGLCYLMPGEAIVFGYVCRTNGTEDTKDVATNTIAMPCYDYNNGGLNLAQNAPSQVANRKDGKPVTDSPDGLTNDGTVELIASGEMDSQFRYPAGASQWLVSSVTSQRDEILPGIEKTLIDPQNGIAGPMDTLTWQLTAHNNGRVPVYGYVITDQIQSPYRFEGDITFKADGDIPWTETISIVRDPQEPKKATVIYRTNNEYHDLTVDGDPVSFIMEYTESIYLRLRIPLQVQIATAEDGGEILYLYFEPGTEDVDMAQALMPGQTLTVQLSTKSYTTDLRYKVFLNQAYLTPTTQSWSEPVNYGNLTSLTTPFTGEEERLSVRNSAQVITTTGVATTSSKEVKQGESTATSTIDNNWILLSNPNGTFTYTLKVTNSSTTPIGQMVLIDNLPEPGDHSTFLEEDPRYSEFKVSLADDPQIQVKLIAQDGTEQPLLPGDYTVGYSSKTSFENGDWQGTTNWLLTKDANTRSLRVIITQEIPPNATVSVSFDAEIDGDSHAGQTAWNSFGYAYQVDKSWLEAAPLKVGVRLKAAPALVKELQTSTGDAFAAETDQTFTFMLYEGEALTLPEDFTEETLKELLAAENRSYTTVSLVVNQGQSITEPYILEDCVDETGDPWVWEANQKYTLVELPGTTGMHYVSTNNRMQPSYTFTYNQDQNQRLRVVNAPNTWSILLHKTDSSQKLSLSGAWFAFYSPNVKDQISDEAYNALKPEHREKAAKTLEKDGTTYYLMSVLETDASGNIEWRDLREESYLYLEIQAPEGYSIRDEEAVKVTWPAPQEDGAVVTCTVINNTHYALPKTGGMGRWQIPALGLILCAAVVTVFLGKRRKKAV